MPNADKESYSKTKSMLNITVWLPADHAEYINNASDDAGQWIRDAIAMRIDCDACDIQLVTLTQEQDEEWKKMAESITNL